ncbi:hypothetical protein [Bdellovibrio sp. HCB2-146]|uniref:hypothetical protein n=1 Tax=Bdellovibrio sp. HCB2-146 TaxID=3394362 RepID=UPI0039BCF9D1
MKIFAFVLAVFFAVSSQADDLKLAQKTWSQYRECGTATTEKKFDACLSQVLMPQLDVLVREKFSEFLLMKFRFADLYQCTGTDTVLPTIPKKNDIYYCMAVLGNHQRVQGYATFEKYKDELRLTSIRYAF